ncbi:MAG: CaiB/BaiF CoA transferase family protein [Frankiaceae bacterium]
MHSQRTSPLDGLLVADFSRVLSGPYATMLLGDLGAEVVKVERPGCGDDTRAWGPPFVDGQSAYYLSVNRNKRSVVLDLTEDAGQHAAQALARRADVLVENFRPGTMERLGLGYDALQRDNPGLVYCSISGFGSGPGAALPGYDFLVQAVGGLMSITGPASNEPTKVGVAVVDILAGLHASIGILAALHERARSRLGQRVEVNLLSALLSGLVNQASNYLSTGVAPTAMGNRHPNIAPYETLATAGRPLVVAVGTDAQFAALCAVLEAPELAVERRFAANSGRVAHRDDLRTALEAALVRRSAQAWIGPLTAAGVPCGLVGDVGEAFALAADLGLDPVVQLPSAVGSPPTRSVANPVTLSATPVTYRRPPPELGADGDGGLVGRAAVTTHALA